MVSNKLSDIISLLVAITILSTTFFQWWTIMNTGRMVMRKWLKIVISVCIIGLIIALILVIK